MRFKLGETELYIDVEIIYIIVEKKENEECFLINQELLKSYGITSTQFVAFLEQEINLNDQSYNNCFELWLENISLLKKERVLNSPENITHNLNNISKIITASEEININKKR